MNKVEKLHLTFDLEDKVTLLSDIVQSIASRAYRDGIKAQQHGRVGNDKSVSAIDEFRAVNLIKADISNAFKLADLEEYLFNRHWRKNGNESS